MEHPQLHHGVNDGIARLDDPTHHERHKLTVNCFNKPPVDRQSLDDLVHFLDNGDSHEVTELLLMNIQLSQPSDGGLEVLQRFFSRSDTILTKVTLQYCNFGSQEEALRLLAAFHTNRTVTDLSILYGGANLEGAALGNSLSGLMQNMQQLQCLECSMSHLRVEGVRAFQPALQANRTLKNLILSDNAIGDEGIRLIATAFVGNTTIEMLGIDGNAITANGLVDITRLLESTQLKMIELTSNRGVFGNAASTHHLAGVISSHEFFKELRIAHCGLGDEGIRLIMDAFVGNTTIEMLDIGYNRITHVGLDDIMHLLKSTQLKTIVLSGNRDIIGNAASIHRLARVISSHEFFKELRIAHCGLGDEGIRLIVDAFVGKKRMEVLDISFNLITSKGLADITRLFESTQLQTIRLALNDDVFDDEVATQHFVTTLQTKKSSVQELPGIDQHHFPGDEDSKIATFASINNSLTRNQQLNRVNLLLTPPPPPPQQQQRAAASMMLKTWHKAITKLAMVPNNTGASAMFKLFTARPQLLEKAAAAAAGAAGAVSHGPQNGGGGGSSNNSDSNNLAVSESSSSTTIISRQQKRQRL